MNIEKLAIEHGSTCYTGQEYHFERWELEAFAKALQSSEPVVNESYDAIDRHLRNSLDDESYANYSAHLENVYNNPTASVSLEKYNKLLELLKRATKNLEPTCDSLYALLNQAIAEAEGKEE